MTYIPKRFYRNFSVEMKELTNNQMGFWTSYIPLLSTGLIEKIWRHNLTNGDAFANFELDREYTKVGIEIGGQRFWCNDYNEFKNLFTFENPLQKCMLRYHSIYVIVQMSDDLTENPPLLTFDTIKYTDSQRNNFISVSDNQLVRQKLINGIECQYRHGMGVLGHINKNNMISV